MYRALLLPAFLLFIAATLRADDTPAPPQQITLELTDGSRIIGAPVDMTALPLKAEFGKIDIPLRLIAQGDFTANRAGFAVKFRNNDTLTGTLDLERIKVQTSYGEANVPLARIARITIKEAPKP